MCSHGKKKSSFFSCLKHCLARYQSCLQEATFTQNNILKLIFSGSSLLHSQSMHCKLGLSKDRCLSRPERWSSSIFLLLRVTLWLISWMIKVQWGEFHSKWNTECLKWHRIANPHRFLWAVSQQFRIALLDCPPQLFSAPIVTCRNFSDVSFCFLKLKAKWVDKCLLGIDKCLVELNSAVVAGNCRLDLS